MNTINNKRKRDSIEKIENSMLKLLQEKNLKDKFNSKFFI